MSNTISVSGTGTAAASPDLAVVSIGVEVMARSIAGARQAAATDMAAVVGSLRGNGIADADMATTSYSINPEYDHREGRRLRGYRVINMVEARIRELESLGEIIDQAAAAGSDHVVVRGLTFAHQDESVLAVEARAAAWEDARARAAQLADLAGIELGPVVSMSEQRAHGGGPVRARTMALEAEMASPMEAGELAVSVNLQVEFAISGAA